MMFKSMVSNWMLEDAVINDAPFTEHQYKHFLSEFGVGEVGFAPLSDVLNEARTGQKSRIFELDSSCRFRCIGRVGLECDIFSAEDFEFKRDKFATYQELDEICSYLEGLQNEGKINTVFNSKVATLLEDKRYFVDFYKEGFPVVESFHFNDFDSFKSFADSVDENLVVKHRFGSEGKGTYRIKRGEAKNLSLLDISDYIVQRELDIGSEKRFIFFGDELLGSRIIMDRTRPWEKEGDRRHETFTYKPNADELESVLDFYVRTGALVGCIDTVDLRDGSNLILEYNGAATGLGYPEGPYDCNKAVAQRLRRMVKNG